MLDPRLRNNHQQSPRMQVITPEEDEDVSNDSEQQQSTSPSHVQQRVRQVRQSKRLSLNFPILVPSTNVRADSQSTSSPSNNSAQFVHHSPYFLSTTSHTQDMSAPSTVTIPMPLTPPSEVSEDNISQPLRSPTAASRVSKKNTHRRSQSTALHQLNSSSSPDFLTLLASQERRVMELKEELARAENELVTLKRSWAVHEASKKKVELKARTVQLSPVQGSGTAKSSVGQGHARTASHPANTSGLGLNLLDEDGFEEARRELLRQKLLRRGTLENKVDSSAGIGKKSGQRIFSGSRHTRTLSLLNSGHVNVGNQRKNSVGGNDKTRTSSESSSPHKMSFDLTTPPADREDGFDSNSPPMPSLSRSNTTSSLSKIRDSTSLNFGKTYKELASAASKRSIPQGLQIVNGSAEVLVKQGKTVVDGVRDGLWTFFEDIRQATVGDEAVREVQPASRRQGGDTGLSRSKSMKNSKEKETSFWKEFGVDTPQGDKTKKQVTDESTPTCSKHSHAHTRNFSKPLVLQQNPGSPLGRNKPVLPISTNPDDSPIEPDLTSEEIIDVLANKPREREHGSKPSTDSSDSRTPPSLFSDSTTPEEREAEEEEESWEWKSIESPASMRFKSGDVTSSIVKRETTDAEWHGLAS